MPVPRQVRSTDAFSENRFSSVVNRLSRIITAGENTILFPYDSFLLTLDATSCQDITISPGLGIKDDVLVQITENTILDCDSTSNYIDVVGGLTESRRYMIVLEYTYARTLPAPQAIYKIIRDIENIYVGNESKYLMIGLFDVEYDAILLRYYITHVYIETSEYPREVLVGDFAVIDGGDITEEPYV